MRRRAPARGGAGGGAAQATTGGTSAAAAAEATGGVMRLGRDELVPLLDHVDVLVHQRVPARDAAHARLVAAAVAAGTGLGQQVAVGALDVGAGGLAFHPVRPLV